MANIEQKNVEVSDWWAEGKKKEYENILKGKEFGKKETQEDRQKAEELLKQIQSAQWPESKKEAMKKNASTLPPEIKTAINQLDRPEAKIGIEQSYTAIEQTIKNSPNDKNPVARVIGKIINRINP